MARENLINGTAIRDEFVIRQDVECLVINFESESGLLHPLRHTKASRQPKAAVA